MSWVEYYWFLVEWIEDNSLVFKRRFGGGLPSLVRISNISSTEVIPPHDLSSIPSAVKIFCTAFKRSPVDAGSVKYSSCYFAGSTRDQWVRVDSIFSFSTLSDVSLKDLLLIVTFRHL